MAQRPLVNVRLLYALTGALLMSSVALMSHALAFESGSGPYRAARGPAETAAAATDRHADLAFEPTRPVRQGGDITDASRPAVERSATAPATDRIRPTVWYWLAAAEYGVSVQLLEALHQVESNASSDACIVNLEGSGATGPFQFKRATFSTFGVDANYDGVTDICGFVDSLFSAARYLRAIGADGDPASEASRRALARYGTDVERVVSLARAYQERDGLLAMVVAPARE